MDAVHAVLPTVADQSAALGLSNCSRSMSAALAELCAAVGMVQDISPAHVPQQTDIDAALSQVQALHDDLAEIRQSLAAKKLVPLPGDKMEKCSAELGATSKLIGSSMAQLLTAAAQVPDVSYHFVWSDTCTNRMKLRNFAFCDIYQCNFVMCFFVFLCNKCINCLCVGNVMDSDSEYEFDGIRHFFINPKSDGYLKSDRVGFATSGCQNNL